jgi:hypothetical protein
VSWFSASKTQPASAPHGASEPAAHHSLGFRALTKALGRAGGTSILDLGPALGQNIAFFGQFGCRVHVGDLYRSRLEAGVYTDEEHPQRRYESLLPLANEEGFDVVIAWDLLDYLDAKEVDALMAHLRPALREGALLFAMVSYQKDIPASPIRFRIADHEHLVYETAGAARRPCPRHKLPDLERHLPGFKIDSSFLLRNGMQEYLWAYRQPLA